MARHLRRRGILYAPDYVINGGGIVCVAGQIFDWNDAETRARTRDRRNGSRRFFAAPKRKGARPIGVADRMAEERMTKASSQGAIRAAE